MLIVVHADIYILTAVALDCPDSAYYYEEGTFTMWADAFALLLF